MQNLLSAAQSLTADSHACPKALGSGLTSYELHIDLQGDAGLRGGRDSFQSKDLDWLDPCDRHRDEGKAPQNYVPAIGP
ncbi:MAG: hypothetical protein DI595_13165 [Agrobacterium fabrum]|uniref:Uncharacterized protein n=1 Tax=Agrobacterium fabrum TaxID=1176649 RepID=A0A2W5H732_9HYPH|nr:MAG: hypothetical protein DI595_13165 [Agrobacterium fabrum]